MASGNSTRDVNLNTNSTLSTTIYVNNNATIAPVAGVNVTLADATVGDVSLISNGTGPDCTMCILEAGDGITITPGVVDDLIIARSGNGYYGVTVGLESVTTAPVGAEVSLFDGPDPEAAAATISLKKLKATDGTVSIVDDGEFLDLAAHLSMPTSVAYISNARPSVVGASLIAHGLPPYAVLKNIVGIAPVTVTADPYYVFIGSGFGVTNADIVGSFPLLVNTADNRVQCKALKKGTNVTMQATNDQIIINGLSSTQTNQLRVAGPDGTTVAIGGYSIAIGSGAVANASDTCLAIGGAAICVDSHGIAVGQNALVTGLYGIAIGDGANAGTTSSIAIGRAANCDVNTTFQSISIGDAATTTQTQSIAFGSKASATAVGTIVLTDGSLNPAPNTTSGSMVVINDSKRILEVFTTTPSHAVSWGPAFHDWSEISPLENFSEKGENPLHVFQFCPNAALYMPKVRNQDHSPAFNTVSDINEATMYGGVAGAGALGAGVGAGIGAAVAGAVGAGFLLCGGATVLGATGTAAGVVFIDGAVALAAPALLPTVFLTAFPPVALFVAGVIVIAGAILATVVITAIVAALVVHWATSLWLQNNPCVWKFQLPPYWNHYATMLNMYSYSEIASTAWTFECINKAGQYGQCVFKIEDNAYAAGYAYVEQRDGGRAQSWTADSGEKQTIGISFVPHPTVQYAVRYTILSGPHGG